MVSLWSFCIGGIDIGNVNARLDEWLIYQGRFVNECNLFHNHIIQMPLANSTQRTGIAQCANYICHRHWIVSTQPVPKTYSLWDTIVVGEAQKQSETKCALTCYYTGAYSEKETQEGWPEFIGPMSSLMEVLPPRDEDRWTRGHLRVRATTMSQERLENMTDCLRLALADTEETLYINATMCLNNDSIEPALIRSVHTDNDGWIQMIPIRYCVLSELYGGFGTVV